MHDDDATRPVIDSAIVWFAGWDPDNGPFADAVDAGYFLLGDGWDGRPVENAPRAWPAAGERAAPDGGRGWQQVGRRLGIDVARACLVVEIDAEERVVISLAAGNFAVELGRNAIAEQGDTGRQ